MDPAAVTEPELVEVSASPTAVVAAVVPAGDIAAFFDRSFPAVAEAVAAQGATIAGPAFALHHQPPGETFDLEVGFATDRTVEASGDVRPGALPGGRVARLVHAGGYDELDEAWERLRSWIDDRGLTGRPGFWEVYVTEPSPDMDPADLRTELNWPVED
jgi:effector-binding domain-containing protein